MVFVSVCFFLYSGVSLIRLTQDQAVRDRAQTTDFPAWFSATYRRYTKWANEYLESRYASHASTSDIAGTEWPLFGTVFFLVSAEQLLAEGKLELDSELRAALDVGAKLVAEPSTATWVQKHWGEDYLHRENVFYRMLFIHGLTSFERATGDSRYHATQRLRARTLGAELMAATHHLADDYPGQCYPTDVVWAVAAIQRALGHEAHPLVDALIKTLDERLLTKHGVPAFSVNARTAHVYEGSRGSANSGLLSFASELDSRAALRWYTAYADNHWVDGFVRGFREAPHDGADIMDVDSVPVIDGMGSVASLFGIGAARANGRLDHAVPLTLQVLAVS